VTCPIDVSFPAVESMPWRARRGLGTGPVAAAWAGAYTQARAGV